MSENVQARVQLDETYSQRLQELQQQAAIAAVAAPRGLPVPWYRPQGWDGDPGDYAALHVPFDRRAINQAGIAALRDPQQPGTVGDVIAASLQAETLACMERALRVRHTYRRVRCAHLAAARWNGHAKANGVWFVCGRGYVHAIVQGAAAR